MSQPQPAAHERKSVLLVDDDDAFRDRMARALRDRGYEVRPADGYDAAVAAAREDSPEYALVDLRMPGEVDGEAMRKLALRFPGLPMLVVTGHLEIAPPVHYEGYFAKPFDTTDLLAAIEHLYRAHHG